MAQRKISNQKKTVRKRAKTSIWKPILLVILSLVLIVILGIQIKRYIHGDGFGLSPAAQAPKSRKYKSLDVDVPDGYTVYGIDISKHQGKINWKEVKAMNTEGISVSFVIMKATEGASRIDAKFEYNWEECRKHDIIRGAYHFFIPWRTAEQQAQNFLSKVDLEKGDLPPIIDFEYKRKNLPIKELKKLCDIFEKKFAKPPIIYTNLNLYKTYLKGTDFEKDYYIWIAAYDMESAYKNDLIKNRNFLMWQFTEKSRIDGIEGRVDLNVFNTKKSSLNDLLIGN